YQVGGEETHVQYLATHLSNHHDVTVFATNEKSFGQRTQVVAPASVANNGKYTTYYLDKRFGSISFDAEPYDLVHLHGYHRIFMDLLVTRLSLMRKRIVSTLHGSL